MYITCIGARVTPANILIEMTKIASILRANKHIIRSGHALGADIAFEKGAVYSCEVYLPWIGFNKEIPIVGNAISDRNKSECDLLVNKYHPNPTALNNAARQFMQRNCQQVLGKNLNDPSVAVICWTPEGKYVGGTSFAMRLADAYNIPIFNMFNFPTEQEVQKELIRVIHSNPA